jgi:hypothetical protein
MRRINDFPPLLSLGELDAGPGSRVRTGNESLR